MFNVLTGLGILLFLNIFSGFLVSCLHLQFPAPLLGMLILVALLQLKVIPVHVVEGGCRLLLDNMGLFFVPLLVGIVLYVHLIAVNAVPIVLTVAITTVLVMCATGITVDYLIHRRKRAK